MDKTEQFQKMCETAERAAPELFYKSVYDVHDYVFRVEGNDLLWWLPRQDQLQEMVKRERLEPDYQLAKVFGDWCYDGLLSGTMASMEQLWLSYLIQEKYNKIWDGKKWA